MNGMFNAGAQIMLALLSGVVGGGIAVLAVILALRAVMASVESAEIRRQKLQCLSNIAGLRFLIGQDQQFPLECTARFNMEMNRISILWSDDPEVLVRLREFHGQNSNELLARLLRAMANTTKMPLNNLGNSDIAQIIFKFKIPPAHLSQ